eukprot:7756055-Alexandrium_andersonii.AAC.1
MSGPRNAHAKRMSAACLSTGTHATPNHDCQPAECSATPSTQGSHRGRPSARSPATQPHSGGGTCSPCRCGAGCRSTGAPGTGRR